jgi:IS5 family transposase
MSSRPTKIENVARLALEVSEESFPEYYHRFAPKKFRIPQLIACLLLKVYLRQDYRGIEDMLKISPPLRKALGLKKVPDYSTLARTFSTASSARLESMLNVVVKRAGVLKSAAAVDSTGFQVGTASAYYQARRGKQMRGFVKLSLAVLLPSLLVVSANAARGPANDRTSFLPTMQPALERTRITKLYADAGYDAEWIHEWCRGKQGIESWIQPIWRNHPIERVKGAWRREQRIQGMPKEYGRRWGVETVNSVIKRKWGGTTAARTLALQRREVLLKTVVYAVDR